MAELNKQDQEVLDKLIDSNQKKEVRFPFEEAFQRSVLGMLLCDRFFLCQSVGLIKKEYFTSEIHQLTCGCLFEYFDHYRHIPSKIFMVQLIVDFLKQKNQNKSNDNFEAVKLLYLGELNLIYDYYTRGGKGDMIPCLDSQEAILDKITSFAKSQAMKYAFFQSLDLIRKNPESDATFVKVDEIYTEARLVNRQIDIGLNYFETVEERYERMAIKAEEMEVFSTGFDIIDRSLQGGGLTRGEIGAYMGKPGAGKSLALVGAAVKNLIKGKKVLYVSTEMDEDRIATRFDAQISLIGQHLLMSQKENVFRALHDEVRDYEDKRRLIIKQFPSGSADMNSIRALYSQLHMRNFKPDLLIVDYPGDMKHPDAIPLHRSLQKMVTDLRGFGSEEKHCTLIAIQPNRGGSELTIDEYLDESKQADSFGQNRVLDAFWSLNQTNHEKKASVGRVFVIKGRNGKSNFSFKIYYDYAKQTLGMSEISDDKWKFLMNKVKESDGLAVDLEYDGPVAKEKEFVPSEGEQLA